MTTFANALETIEQLSIEDQEDLMETFRRRLAERRRAKLIVEVQQAREEAKTGKLKTATPDEIMRMVCS